MIIDFKLFEKEGDKFKIGTWVLLDDESDMSNWNVYPYAKIINRESTLYHNDEDEDLLNDYEVEVLSLLTNRIETMWIDDFEIERKLTKKEIKDMLVRIDAIKYNI